MRDNRGGRRRSARRGPLVLLALGLGTAAAYGTNAILSGFRQHYPTTTIPDYTVLVSGDECLDCHSSSKRADPGNAYREDLIATKLDREIDFSAVDSLDSDGDGVLNAIEATLPRVDFPTDIEGARQVGYNPGLIDCPPDADGAPRLGYDPVSMRHITNVHETPPGGTVWSSEMPGANCDDGLDNDCDGVRDAEDPDCLASGCASDADCDDGLFCNGGETCEAGTGRCLAGIPPAVDDAIDCTVDFCEEDLDAIVHSPSDARCDDGLFCNGAEICDAASGCTAGTAPCAPGEACDEEEDRCGAGALDLDIVGFRAPHRLSLSRRVRDIVLVVKNGGAVEGTATAVLTSVNPDTGAMLVRPPLAVSDPVGDGRSSFTFPFPVSLGTGTIVHTVTIEDGDPDDDTASDITVVVP
ncbi:MAG: hypothetical protein ACE5JH_01915 [Acidobacteriota bacterium]